MPGDAFAGETERFEWTRTTACLRNNPSRHSILVTSNINAANDANRLSELCRQLEIRGYRLFQAPSRKVALDFLGNATHPPASSCSSRSRQARTRPHNWRPSMNSARSRRPSRCSCCFVNCASSSCPASGRGPGMLQPGRRPTLHRRAPRQRPARMARPGRPQAAARLCPAGPAHAGERPLQRPRTPRPGAGQAVADRLGSTAGAWRHR